MAGSKPIRRTRRHPGLELCGWIAILLLGLHELAYAPGHLGAFGVWFQIAVSAMGVVASGWRLRSGDR